MSTREPTSPVILTCDRLGNLFAPARERGDHRLIMYLEMTAAQRLALRHELDKADAGYYDESEE